MKKSTENSTRLPKKEADQPKKMGGAREGSGRKAFLPTDAERKQVEDMSGYGVPFEQIAALVREGIDIDTLRKYFSAELVNGKAKAMAQSATYTDKFGDMVASLMIRQDKETARPQQTRLSDFVDGKRGLEPGKRLASLWTLWCRQCQGIHIWTC
jgi:hypothetical protein